MFKKIFIRLLIPLLTLILASANSISYSQLTINQNSISPVSGITFDNISNKILTLTASSNFKDNNRLSTYGFTNNSDILFIEDEYGRPLTKYTAYTLYGLCNAYSVETDIYRIQEYESYINLLSEYLVYLYELNDSNGGIWSSIVHINASLTTTPEPYSTSITGLALLKCGLTMNNSDLVDIATNIGSYTKNNLAYPYNYTYYSNVNILARQLIFMSDLYAYNSDATLLDPITGLVEEIIAWQDFQHSSSPWTSLPDGSWYYYTYNTAQPPAGTPSFTSGSNDFNRITVYHSATANAIAHAYNALSKQLLPLYTTYRNNDTSIYLKNKLLVSLTKSINYLIVNQETTSNPPTRVYGLIRRYSNSQYIPSGQSTLTTSHITSPSGLDLASYLAKINKKYKIWDTTSSTYLDNFVASLTLSSLANDNNAHYLNTEWINIEMIKNLSVASLLFASPGPVDISNSLSNFNFNSRYQFYFDKYTSSNTNIITSENNCRSNKCVKIVDNNSNGQVWISQLVSTSANNSISFGGYLNLLSGVQTLYIHAYDEDGDLLSFSYNPISNANGNYTYYSTFLTTPSSTKFIRLTLYSSIAHTSEAYWDDLYLSINSMTQISESIFNENNNSNNDILLNESDEKIEIYPNPTNGVLNINIPFEFDSNIIIYNVLGQQVRNITLKKGNNLILLANLNSGIYFFRLKGNIYKFNYLK